MDIGDPHLHLVGGKEDEQRQDVVRVAADVGDQQDRGLRLQPFHQGGGD